MKKVFAYGVASAQGAWPVQEDGYVVDPARGCFTLADGFGGAGAGDISVRIALEEARKNQPPPDGPLPPEVRRHREIFFAAHKRIQERNQSRAPAGKGGCSLLLATLEGGRFLTLSQCGSCSAFLRRGGRLLPLLLPQCPPEGEFPLLEHALGLADVLPESRVLELIPGDVVVLASGGVEWSAEGFAPALEEQLSLRLPGDSFSLALTALLEGEAVPSSQWNRTLVMVEAH